VALTLALPARLTFVLILLIFQTYSLMLQVYKVSQEEIPEQLTPLQGWFLKWFFLGFLKSDTRRPSFRPQNAAAPPAIQVPPTGANPSTQPKSNGSTPQSTPPEPHNPGPLNSSSDLHHAPLNGNINNCTTTKLTSPPTELPPPSSDRGPSWTSLWIQGNTIAIFLLGLSFSIPIFNKLQIAQEGLNTAHCTAPIDGDIAGDGVRAALWVQQGILWLSVLTGAFLKASQPRPTAVKELAAGLVVTHLSLAIAVLVQIGQGTLTPLDAGIVVMILDAQNAALAVAFSSRETLAARWEVVSISAAQVFGLVVIGVVLARFEEGGFVTGDCKCFEFFWWAWQSTCEEGRGLPAAERAVLWAYYAFRWLNSAQNWHFGVRYMWIFNIMEQDKELWDGVGATGEGEDGTPGVPPTAGFGFLQNLVFGLVSSVAAELTITGYTSGDEPKPFTVGQITAMVIAVTTTLRATWLFIRRFDLLPMIEGKLWSDETVETEGLDVSEAENGDGAVEPQSIDAGRGSGSGDDAEKGASSQVDGLPADVTRTQS